MGDESGCGAPILVADGDDVCRALITTLLERIGRTTCEATTGPEALALAESVRPALAVLDVALPGITGYETCRELHDRYGDDLPVVLVSGTRVEPLDRVAGLLIGADDYIVKPFDPDELLARLRLLLQRRNGNPDPGPENGGSAIATLTAREHEVLVLLADGRRQSEIADELFITPKTVATHIQRVLAKLGVHSRAQAVALAHRHGLVDDFEAHALAPSLDLV